MAVTRRNSTQTAIRSEAEAPSSTPASSLLFCAGALVGSVCALGYPGPGLWPLYVIALVALSWVCQKERSWRRTLAFVAGFAVHYPVLFLGTLPWGNAVPLSVGATLFLCACVPLVVWSRLVASAWPTSKWSVPLLFVTTLCAGTLFEQLLAWLHLPFHQATVLASAPWLLPAARIIGAPGVGGWLLAWVVVLANTLLHWPHASTSSRKLGLGSAAAGPLLLLALLGVLARASAPAASTQLRVGIPQLDVGRSFYLHQMFNPPMRGAFDAQVQQMVDGLAGAQLLVTPEELDNRFYLQLPPLLRKWQAWAQERHMAILLSAPSASRGGRANVILGLAPSGHLVGVHRKVNLAPFGESQYLAGHTYTTLPLLPDARIASLVCLESALLAPYEAAVASSANAVAVATDDLSFGSSPVAFLHLAATQLGAAHSGREVVWASNGGPSGVVDRMGRFHPSAPFRQPQAARLQLSTFNDVTPWLRGRSAALAVAAAVLLLSLAWRRRQHGAAGITGLDALWQRRNRALAIGATSSTAALLLVLLTPIVEARHGVPRRALQALVEPWSSSGAAPPPGALVPYLPTDGNQAAAAASFFLAEYGLYQSAREVAANVEAGSDSRAMQAALLTNYGMRTARVALGDVPVDIAALVRGHNGEWASVACHPSGTCLVFRPALTKQEAQPRRALLAWTEVALLPAAK